MPLFTASGLAKLDQFRAAVSQVLDSKEEKSGVVSSSDYSKTMARNAIAIIDALKKHNNDKMTGLDSLEKIFKDITAFIAHIDNNTFTAIPVVFNDESAILAEVFIKFLEALDVKTDFGSSIQFLIKAKGLVSNATPEDSLKQHIRECQAQLNVYKKICAAREHLVTSDQLREKIALYFGIKGRGKESFPDGSLLEKLQNHKLDYHQFLDEYKRKVDEFIEEALIGPYVTLRTPRDFVNAERPYLFDLDGFLTSSPGSTIFRELEHFEADTNLLLKQQGWDEVHYFMERAGTIFTPEKVAARKKAISDFYNEFFAEKTVYDTGAHLGTFKSKSVNTAKKAILKAVADEMKTFIQQAEEKPDSLNFSLLAVFKRIYNAANDNIALGKSAGRCGKILRTYQVRVLDLLLQGEWGNDEMKLFIYHPESRKPAVAPKTPRGPT